MNKKLKYRLLFSLFTIISSFSFATIYTKTPIYLQQYYNDYVSDHLIPFSDYQKNIFDNVLLGKIKNVKSSYIGESSDFSLEHIKNNNGIHFYKNIYDSDITNLIVTKLESYQNIDYGHDHNIKAVIEDNIKNGFFEKQSFYIRQNYSFKNWLYSNEDNRKNIINLSMHQIKRIESIFHSKLTLFTDTEKSDIATTFTVAHEMAHTQKYQLLTDISFENKESLADLSAVIYIVKELNFDIQKSNQIIDSVELFRKNSIGNINASGYYNPYNYLEILRNLLNQQNPILLNVKNNSINSLAIKISQYQLVVSKKQFKKYLLNTGFKIDNDILSNRIIEYSLLLNNVDNASKNLNKADRQSIVSIAQTYNTSANRADALAFIRLNHVYNKSFNAYLELQSFKKENILFVNIIDAISSIYQKEYNNNINLTDKDTLIFNIDQLFEGNTDIPLENFIKILSIINPKETYNLIDNIQNLEYNNKSYIYNKF